MKTLTYEFVVPSQICIVDATPWSPLAISINDTLMSLRKPIVGTKLMRADQTLGNEGVVVEYTILRVDLELQNDQPDPEWHLPYYLCKECLSWIRVAGRQYWLGILMSASDSFARGSIICTKDSQTSYKNFGASRMPVPPIPLSVEMWKWVGTQVQLGFKPSIPDVMFCDALLNFRDNDFLQTIIQFGITCELELNALIDDLLTKQPEQAQKIYASSRFAFEWKLKNMLGILGIQPYQVHNERFCKLICDLYTLRGSAVHRAKCLIDDMDPVTKKKGPVPVAHSHVSQFLFAVDDFLSWAKQKRTEAGILVPLSVSAPTIPYLIGPAK